MAKEFQSTAQVTVSTGVSKDKSRGLIEQKMTSSRLEKIFEQMLEDPTIRLAIDIITAMLKRQPWTVEGDDDEYCTFVFETLEPHREMIIRSSLRGLLRNGWRAFEAVYELDPESKQIGLAGLKALKNKYTKPLAYVDTGEFAGVENKGPKDKEAVLIDEEHVLFINFDDEGFGDLAEPLFKVALGPHLRWLSCDEGASRYDKKVAGGFLHVQYPVGVTPFAGNGGAETDHAVIVQHIVANFEAAGYVANPVKVDPDSHEVLDVGWEIDYISSAGGLQPNFVAREKYLDALKLRAFGIPERTTTEGTFGTKAEAEAHADVAVIINTDRHGWIIDTVNRHLVQRINMQNTGNKDECRLVLGKLDPQDRELFATIFASLMTDPVLGEQIASRVDSDILLDKLNIPTRPPEDDLLTPEPAPLTNEDDPALSSS